MVKLSSHDLSQFHEMFNLVDTDKSGTISAEELGRLLETLKMQVNPDELKKIVEEIDEDGNGQIDFNEFIKVMNKRVETTFTAKEVKQAFNLLVYDKHGPYGTIATQDLYHALVTYGTNKLSPDQAEEIIQQLDIKNSRFNFHEFVYLMMDS